jgi:hypothetical protein
VQKITDFYGFSKEGPRRCIEHFKVWCHYRRSDLGRTAPSIRPDMIIGKDRPSAQTFFGVKTLETCNPNASIKGY